MEGDTLTRRSDNKDAEEAGDTIRGASAVLNKSADVPARSDNDFGTDEPCSGVQCDISKKRACGRDLLDMRSEGSLESYVNNQGSGEFSLATSAAIANCVPRKEQLCCDKTSEESYMIPSNSVDGTDVSVNIGLKEKRVFTEQLDSNQCVSSVASEIINDRTNSALISNPDSLSLIAAKQPTQNRSADDQAVAEVSISNVLTSTGNTPKHLTSTAVSYATNNTTSSIIGSVTSNSRSSVAGNSSVEESSSTPQPNPIGDEERESRPIGGEEGESRSPADEERETRPMGDEEREPRTPTGEGREPQSLPAAPTRVHVRVQAASPVMFLREQLFLALFHRMAVLYAQSVSRPLQRFIEFFLLSQALLSFAALTYIHVVFVREPVNCLQQVHTEWTRVASTNTGGILRVEILRDVAENYSLSDSYVRERMRRGGHSARHSYTTSADSADEEKEEDDLKIEFGSEAGLNSSESDFIHLEENVTKFKAKPDEDNEGLILSVLNHLLPNVLGYTNMELNFEDLNIFEYATEFGFLQLTPETRARLNMTVLHVVLDPDKEKCMGKTFARFLLQEFLGYEDVVLSSFQLLTPRGYAANLNTGVNYKFTEGPGIENRNTYITAFFLMILFTLSVSMLLRCSHHQIFIFIVEVLQLLNRMTLITFPIAQLIIAVSALVGIETLMSHIFVEESTAFFVILTVWLADQYDVICCTTSISRRYFLRFFYLYHFLFYAYHCRFHGQFSWMAMICSWLFIQHAMVYFFHHYELPPIIRQAELRRILVHHHTTIQQHHGTGQVVVTPRPDAAVPAGHETDAASGSAPYITGARRYATVRRRGGGVLARWSIENVSIGNVSTVQPAEGDGRASVESLHEGTTGPDRSTPEANQGNARENRVGISFRRVSNTSQQNTTVGWLQLPSGFSVTSYVVRDGSVQVIDRNSTESIDDPLSTSADSTESVDDPLSTSADSTEIVDDPRSTSADSTEIVDDRLSTSADSTEIVDDPLSTSADSTEIVDDQLSTSADSTEIVDDRLSTSADSSEIVDDPLSTSADSSEIVDDLLSTSADITHEIEGDEHFEYPPPAVNPTNSSTSSDTRVVGQYQTPGLVDSFPSEGSGSSENIPMIR